MSPSPPTGATTASDAPGLELVAIGDSIPFNASYDCPGCTGFVDRYASAVESAAGQTVNVVNLSQHTGLTLPGLIDQLDSYTEDLAGADVIVVGIAHNSSELATFRPCGAPLDENDLPDWSKVDGALVPAPRRPRRSTARSSNPCSLRSLHCGRANRRTCGPSTGTTTGSAGTTRT